MLRPALTLLVLFTLLCGMVYPLLITGIGQAIFPHQANGSQVVVDGKVIGSSLIGKSFTGERYFWPRPSATEKPYDAAASSGSNQGPLHPALLDAIKARTASVATEGLTGERVPIDLVTASASGLDPHISPAAAFYQADRVARARGLPPAEVRSLVEAHVEDRSLGIFGEPRVNVLLLNLALDGTSTPRLEHHSKHEIPTHETQPR